MGGLDGLVSKGVFGKGEDHPCVFYIGIIDLLVTCRLKTRLAHSLKANTIGYFNPVGTEPPGDYAERFRNYFRWKIVSDKEKVAITHVPKEFFETPFPSLTRSGGTAAFFGARIVAPEVRCPERRTSDTYWIGKDLAHAGGEVLFYEKAKLMVGQKGYEFLRWMMPYKGVCSAPCKLFAGAGRGVSEDTVKELRLMLIRNARDGFETCRMLDVKIGWVTAVAGWQGKSALRAWKQGFVDSSTNSVVEGFRLEGFDNPPATLASFEKMLPDSKRLRRLNLQRMDAIKFMRLFVDLHSTALDEDRAAAAAVDPGRLAPVEIEELVLLGCIEELSHFVDACRKAPVPQQWLGSSVMLAFDSSARPARAEAVRRRGLGSGFARVHIFDWGRSELNVASLHARLSEEERASRSKYWGLYCGGVAKLLCACCALYVGRFWQRKASVLLAMWDKDRFTDDDFIGTCVLPLEPTERIEADLRTWQGEAVKAGGPLGMGGRRSLLGIGGRASRLGVSVSALDLPQRQSRLEQGVAVRVHAGTNIPKMDYGVEHTDAFVEVAALPQSVEAIASDIKDGNSARALRRACHTTTLQLNTLAPVFGEEFQFAALREGARAEFRAALALALGAGAAPSDSEVLQMFAAAGEPTLAGSTFAQKCFPGLKVDT